MWKGASKVGAWYTRCLAHSPFVTNSVTGFIIAGAGDALCQKYFEPTIGHDNSIDKKRVLEMGIIRAVVITPIILKWYSILAAAAPGATFISALKRVALDQAFGSPIVIGSVFIAKAVLIGDPMLAQDAIRNNLWATWLVGLQYWPIVHTINFRFVPLIYQPLFGTFASLYWNAVLSFYANKDANAVESVMSVGVAGVLAPAALGTSLLPAPGNGEDDSRRGEGVVKTDKAES